MLSRNFFYVWVGLTLGTIALEALFGGFGWRIVILRCLDFGFAIIMVYWAAVPKEMRQIRCNPVVVVKK